MAPPAQSYATDAGSPCGPPPPPSKGPLTLAWGVLAVATLGVAATSVTAPGAALFVAPARTGTAAPPAFATRAPALRPRRPAVAMRAGPRSKAAGKPVVEAAPRTTSFGAPAWATLGLLTLGGALLSLKALLPRAPARRARPLGPCDIDAVPGPGPWDPLGLLTPGAGLRSAALEREHGRLAMLASLGATAPPAYDTIRAAQVVDPRDDSVGSPLAGLEGRRVLVVLLPQLGEFDSSEFVEQLVAVGDDLSAAGIALRVVGIANAAAARRFSDFSGLPLEQLRVDPDAALHKALGLHAGPDWDVPGFVSDGVLRALLGPLPGGAPDDADLLRPVARAWLNYLAMCTGIAAPGTLPEILRGYFGDRSAPERFAPDAVVKAGPVEIGPGVGPVKLGPLRYSQGWKDETGYQRPVELATVRLRSMAEVLGHWEDYVSNPAAIDRRGATYLFDAGGAPLYAYRHRGVLTYSQTMSRPLTFLAPFLGARALNPLGLGDNAVAQGGGAGAEGAEGAEG